MDVNENQERFHDRARVYAPGERRPEYSLFFMPSIHSMAVATVGGQTDVFVPDYGTEHPIFIFRAHRRQAFAAIQNNLHGINGVAFKPAGVP